MKNKISVIIPAYNCEKYIEKCIYSVLNQNFKNYEILIIDDGSTDNTKKIVKEIKNKEKNIQLNYIYQKNQGVAAARNKGIELSNGEYIMFIDADDYIDADFLSEMYEYCKNNNIDILRSGYKIVNNNYKVIEEINYFHENIIFDKKDFNLFIDTTSFGYVGGLFINKNIIKNNKFDVSLKFAEDLDFIIRCYSNSKIMAYYSKTSYNYFYNVNSATKSNNLDIRIKEIDDNIEVFTKFVEYGIENWKISNILYKRINMKLKYIIKNCNISFKKFENVLSNITKNQKFKKYANLYDLDKIDGDKKNKILIKLIIKKQYFLYYVINKIHNLKNR